MLSPCTVYLHKISRSHQYMDGNVSREHGFLPPRVLVAPLPTSHSAWEQAARELPHLVFSSSAQDELSRMPLLSAEEPSLPDPHLKRAAVIMGLLASGYWRFGIERLFLTRNSDIEDGLPPAILEPWKTICRRLGRSRHYQSTEDLLSNNFTFLDGRKCASDGGYDVGDAVVENLRNLIPVFNNEAERVFYSAMVEVQAASAPLVEEICYVQHRILESGVEARDDVVEALERMSACVKAATNALSKVSARPDSGTYCDPILWAKTVAIFNVPPTTYPSGPMSGAALPVVHTLDSLVGRRRFDSDYGKFSRSIQAGFLPEKLRGFLAAMNEVSIREYVCAAVRVDQRRSAGLAVAFDALVDSYAGNGGFLATHVAKVTHYLGVGTLVGRNQSTSGDQRHVGEQSWTHVAAQLQVSAGERLAGRIVGRAEREEPTTGRGDIEGLPEFSIIDVARHRSRDDGWVVLHGRVVDVSEFASRHPGGAEILCASLGRDGSVDFALVAGHDCPSVRRLIATTTVGTLRRSCEREGISSWYEALDYATKMHNALRIQHEHAIAPVTKVIFFGQAYCHFIDEHLAVIVKLLGASAASCAEALGVDARAVGSLFRRTVTEFAGGDRAGESGVLLDHLGAGCLGLADRIIEACSRVIGEMEAGLPLTHADRLARADEIAGFIREWLGEELRFWRRPVQRTAARG
jgi:cytochrome b involved in lipid metabolism